MLVVTRYRVKPDEVDGFEADAKQALEVLSRRPGWVRGRLGRNADDPELWVLTTEWINVGSYRRALSPYEVKVTAVQLLSRCIDEPTAYELIETVES